MTLRYDLDELRDACRKLADVILDGLPGLIAFAVAVAWLAVGVYLLATAG